jgi:aminopeptidase N
MTRPFVMAACLAAGACQPTAKIAPPDAAACVPPGEADVEVDAQHYRVALELDASGLAGSADVRLAARSPGSVVALDARWLDIGAVRDRGAPACFATEAEHVRVRLARPVAAGEELTLSFDYRARPSPGLHLGPSFAYTAFHTDTWLPCRFEPDDKATLELTVRAPAGWSVATSTGRPHSAYLFGFAAGRLDETTARTERVALRVLGAKSDAAQRILTTTTLALPFFEERAGVRYPDASYAQAIVPAQVGQELAGMALLTERYAEDFARDEREDWLVAHELSHQWWGNAVTCAGWRHFWMHEALATFMTAAFKESRWGAAAYQREVELARSRYRKLREAGRDRALCPPGPTRADQAGGPIVYAKGMLVLHLLRRRLGDEPFFRSVARFTTAHFGATVTTEQLRAALEEASGADLSPFFADYVLGTVPLPDSE